MTDLEIPFEQDRSHRYRFFEILPGAGSYLLLMLPLLLALVNVTLSVFFILFYLLAFFVRSVAYASRAISGYNEMKRQFKLDWNGLAADVDAGEVVAANDISRPRWHLKNLRLLNTREYDFRPKDLLHAVIIATVNESREVLEPTIQSVLASDYDVKKKVILVLAYEARAGKEAEERVKHLAELYGDKFLHSITVKHPANVPGEIIGKGSNVSHAGHALARYVKAQKIDPRKVLVTTLDADNRPDKRYLSNLSYTYCVVPDPLKASYQPLPMYTNNIWDAPSLMRVIATNSNLFYIVGTQRSHAARNFSAHAQPLGPLIDMNFWSMRTIVEDGHHFWRSYFHFDGDYRVYPLSIPIYQDAVLVNGYLRTMKAQFIQLRRWTYGASDVAYVAEKGFFTKNKASKIDVFAKFFRLLEGHITWATSSLMILLAAFIPPLFSPQNLAANELPLIVSRVQRISMIGLLVLIYVSIVTLPPRPDRYKRHRSLLAPIEYALLSPVAMVIYSSSAAFNSQTRLIFKRYLTKFDVTEKAVRTASGKTISTTADPSRS